MALSSDEVWRQRLALVAEASTWILTPYHDCASIKGVGADCLGLLRGAAENVGLIPRGIDFGDYSPTENLHSGEETYLNGVLKYCDEVPPSPERKPLMADLVMWRYGRRFWHIAIVEEWPMVIHSHRACKGVDRIDAEATNWLKFIGENVADKGKPRPRKFLVFRDWL